MIRNAVALLLAVLLIAACGGDTPQGPPTATISLSPPQPQLEKVIEKELLEGFAEVAESLSLRLSNSSNEFKDIDRVAARVRLNLYARDLAIGVEWGSSGGPHLVAFYGSGDRLGDAFKRTVRMLNSRSIPHSVVKGP